MTQRMETVILWLPHECRLQTCTVLSLLQPTFLTTNATEEPLLCVTACTHEIVFPCAFLSPDAPVCVDTNYAT